MLPRLEAARVALVVADSPDLESALAASLSDVPGFEILERTALSALTREAAVAGGPLKIEGADLVIVVERQQSNRYSARLSDARTGAVFQSFVSPPDLEPALTADWLSLRFRPWAAPAEIERKVSLLGLRFETDSEAHRQMERSLNLSLTAALQECSGTVVLERWKLNDLLFEKELVGRGDEPFWQAAQLLDGSISEKDGLLRVRLRERTAGAEHIFEAEGAATDLPDLAAKIVGLLLRQEPRSETSHEVEAAAYVREATWLLQHGLKIEAAQAAETAIALGDASQSTEVLRLRAYAEAAYPENLAPKLVQDADSSYEASDVPPEKLPQSVAMATTVANLSADYAEKYATMPRKKNSTYEHPTVLCVRTMPVALSVLRSAHKLGYWRGNRAAVDDLRDAIKRHIAAVRALPLKHEDEWLDALGAFYRHLIVFAPLWNDTPEQTLEFMEHVLSPDFEEECPGGVILARRNLSPDGFSPPAIATPSTSQLNWGGAPKQLSPRLIDWQNPDNTRVEKLWKDYVEVKLRSPDTLVQADGLAFLWASQATFGEQDTLAPRYVEFLEKHSEELYGLRGQAIWLQIRQPVTRECQRIGSNENRLRVLAVFEKLLRGPVRLPPNLAGATLICLPNSPRHKKVEDGVRVLAALSDYTKMLGSEASRNDLYEIRSVRNCTLRAFPELAPRPPSNALPVTRAWIVSQHTPEDLRKKGRFDEDSGVWYEGRLWFLDADTRKIWKVDPVSFGTEVLAPENRPKAAHDEKGTSGGNNLKRRNRRPLFAAGKLYLPEQGTVWVFHCADNVWKSMELPDAHYSLWLAGGKLFASFGERADTWEKRRGEGVGVYEIDTRDDSTHLIFNTRRRPPQHSLDSIQMERPFCVIPTTNGDALVGFLPPRSFRRLSDGGEHPLIDAKLMASLVSRQGEALFPHTIQKKYATLRGVQRVTSQGKLETLLWNPASDVPQPAEPVWKYPSTIPDPSQIAGWLTYRVAMHGEDLLLVVFQCGTAPWGAGLTDLYLFRRGQPEAKHIPLAFRLSSADETNLKRFHYGSDSFAYPLVDHYGLIPTDKGLAITGRAMPGFWFIPWSELDDYAKNTH